MRCESYFNSIYSNGAECLTLQDVLSPFKVCRVLLTSFGEELLDNSVLNSLNVLLTPRTIVDSDTVILPAVWNHHKDKCRIYFYIGIFNSTGEATTPFYGHFSINSYKSDWETDVLVYLLPVDSGFAWISKHLTLLPHFGQNVIIFQYSSINELDSVNGIVAYQLADYCGKQSKCLLTFKQYPKSMDRLIIMLKSPKRDFYGGEVIVVTSNILFPRRIYRMPVYEIYLTITDIELARNAKIIIDMARYHNFSITRRRKSQDLTAIDLMYPIIFPDSITFKFIIYSDEASIYLHRMEFTFMYCQKESLGAPNFLGFLNPVDRPSWNCLMVSVFILAAVMHSGRHSIGYTMLALTAALLCQRAQVKRFKILFALWMLTGLIFNNGYSGMIRSFFILPSPQRIIETFAGLVTNGFKVVFPHEGYQDHQVFLQIVKNSRAISHPNTLTSLNDTKEIYATTNDYYSFYNASLYTLTTQKKAFLISATQTSKYIRAFQNQSNLGSICHVGKDRIGAATISWDFINGLPISRTLTKFVTTGIFKFWRDCAEKGTSEFARDIAVDIDTSLNYKKYAASSNSNGMLLRTDNAQFRVIFYLLLMLLGFSTSALVVEVIIARTGIIKSIRERRKKIREVPYFRRSTIVEQLNVIPRISI